MRGRKVGRYFLTRTTSDFGFLWGAFTKCLHICVPMWEIAWLLSEEKEGAILSRGETQSLDPQVHRIDHTKSNQNSSDSTRHEKQSTPSDLPPPRNRLPKPPPLRAPRQNAMGWIMFMYLEFVKTTLNVTEPTLLPKLADTDRTKKHSSTCFHNRVFWRNWVMAVNP